MSEHHKVRWAELEAQAEELLNAYLSDHPFKDDDVPFTKGEAIKPRLAALLKLTNEEISRVHVPDEDVWQYLTKETKYQHGNNYLTAIPRLKETSVGHMVFAITVDRCYSEFREAGMEAKHENAKIAIIQRILQVDQLSKHDLENFLIEFIEIRVSPSPDERISAFSDFEESDFDEWTRNLGKCYRRRKNKPEKFIISDVRSILTGIKACSSSDLIFGETMDEKFRDWKDNRANTSGRTLVFTMAGDLDNYNLARAFTYAARMQPWKIAETAEALGICHSCITPESTGIPYILISASGSSILPPLLMVDCGIFLKGMAVTDPITTSVSYTCGTGLEVRYPKPPMWMNEQSSLLLYKSLSLCCQATANQLFLAPDQGRVDEEEDSDHGGGYDSESASEEAEFDVERASAWFKANCKRLKIS